MFFYRVPYELIIFVRRFQSYSKWKYLMVEFGEIKNFDGCVVAIEPKYYRHHFRKWLLLYYLDLIIST